MAQEIQGNEVKPREYQWCLFCGGVLPNFPKLLKKCCKNPDMIRVREIYKDEINVEELVKEMK